MLDRSLSEAAYVGVIPKLASTAKELTAGICEI
jgi:hypothetical protein